MMAPELEVPCSSSPTSEANPPMISLSWTMVSLYQPFQGAKSCGKGLSENQQAVARRAHRRRDAQRG